MDATMQQDAARKKRDMGFEEFIKRNEAKIIATTPINPSVSRDDEWRDETEWDEHNRHLKEETFAGV